MKTGIQFLKYKLTQILNEKILCLHFASKRNGTLYIGLSNNLGRRINEHKNNLIEGFSKEYKIHLLVYAEEFDNVQHAILREKQLKKWNRSWKIELIEKENPDWMGLSDHILACS